MVGYSFIQAVLIYTVPVLPTNTAAFLMWRTGNETKSFSAVY